jgi:hypothetical protein
METPARTDEASHVNEPPPSEDAQPAAAGCPSPAATSEDDDAPAVTMGDLAEVHREVQEVEARLVAQLGRLVPAAKPAAPAAPAKRQGVSRWAVLGVVLVVLLVIAAAIVRKRAAP